MTQEISIIIPAYREGENLQQALDCILTQEKVSYEVIVGVEAEDVVTAEVVRSYAKRFPQIRGDFYPKRISVSRKVNSMLAQSRGEVIVKMDADMVWGHPLCLYQLYECYKDPQIGGVSLRGDRGIRGYEEIFRYVKNSQLREKIKEERTKSFSARGEQFLGRIVDKFRESFFPIAGSPPYPMDIHSFRRKLVYEIDETLIHDDAQFALKVLEKGYAIQSVPEVVLVHLGVPSSTNALFRQKMKGNLGWHAMGKRYSINMPGYYRALLAFIGKNIHRFAPIDVLALSYWLFIYAWSKVWFALSRKKSFKTTWESPR